MDFIINKHLTATAETYETRYSWGHKAWLYRDGVEIAYRKITYYNRTWERYTFESILECLADKAKPHLSKYEHARFSGLIKNEWHEDAVKEIDRQFGMLAGIAKMGEILGADQKEANDWKKRMLKAGLPGLDMPEDWDTLTEDEKTTRLDQVINELGKKGE